MLSGTSFAFPRDPCVYAKTPAPSLDEWQQLWGTWDLVTRRMIPEDELLSQPIHLRNACIFYLGHIPAFLDRHLTRATGEPATEPAHFVALFERGIDPDVDDPAKCHDHSEIPEQWPPVEQILQFQDHVRQRALKLYADGRALTDRRVARSMWIAMEHEGMHLETLLYMLLQSDRMLPPPGPRPDFAALAEQARASGPELQWVRIPRRTITVGMDDPEDDDGPDRYFGWDNEKPARARTVPAFEASHRAITNGEYAAYLAACHLEQLPASWRVKCEAPSNGVAGREANGTSSLAAFVGGKAVRTVYGAVPLQHAWDWPVMASYDELAGCARWMGGRIPTAEEAQSIYAYVDTLQQAPVISQVCAKTIPAVNGHLSNDGVQETPPSLDPRVLFADLGNANVGFRAFHPLPHALLQANADSDGSDLVPAGRAALGGVWEWTSTVLAAHPGFAAMDAYPAYTADFFDGKHNIVLGGSWATVPRIAGRKSFVNWYQRNYPFAWCGARLVRDVVAE